MEVVDHEPHCWFLLRDGDDYFLDVNCGISAVGFSVLVKLGDSEKRAIVQTGHGAGEELAAAIQNSPSRYFDRNLASSHEAAVNEAIARWQKDALRA